jgi:pyrroline-5-carboxylate reductase
MIKGKIVFIGAGNMTDALVKGLIAGGACLSQQILVTDIQPERLELFRRQYGVGTSGNNPEASKKADVIVLAVKPQTMDEVLSGLRDSFDRNAVVVSIAAGIPTRRIESKLGDGVRVIRVMPNTPALVRAGAAAFCGGRWAVGQDFATAETMMRAVGVAVRVDEKDLDAVTALSGSGPAYVFYLVEAMMKAAGKLGLAENVARTLVYATVEGAAKLLLSSKEGPAELRERVTSKGGTTAAAVTVFDERNMADAVVEAVLAAHRRSRELSGS